MNILITGTGRAGTTFLMRLLTFLELDTGFTRDDMNDSIFRVSNSGLERDDLKHKYVKQMNFYHSIPALKDRLECVWLPVRDVDATSKSRERLGFVAGGMWCARTLAEQRTQNIQVIGTVLHDCTVHNVPLKVIDFKRMVTDCDYLFDTLGLGVPRERFRAAYDEASQHSVPTAQSTGKL